MSTMRLWYMYWCYKDDDPYHFAPPLLTTASCLGWCIQPTKLFEAWWGCISKDLSPNSVSNRNYAVAPGHGPLAVWKRMTRPTPVMKCPSKAWNKGPTKGVRQKLHGTFEPPYGVCPKWKASKCSLEQPETVGIVKGLQFSFKLRSAESRRSLLVLSDFSRLVILLHVYSRSDLFSAPT